MKLNLLSLASLLTIALLASLAPAQVQLRQEPLVIPTYKVGQPETNPIFFTGRSYQGAKGPVYPYPLIDKLSDQKVDQKYNALWLENPYVRYCVLPELGGRIFEGKDKTNGYDFIYRQHVIKPALIGMIGAWISGGVEWNIPHHHRASTFMPVDYTTQEWNDGSKTIWVGEIELRHRMKWIVGMTLYPDKSYLKLTVKLFNRTPLPHSLLYFANIGVHANDDYQVIFPPGTEFGTQHGKSEFVSWPIGSGFYGGRDRRGVDLSWWKNLPAPVSIFAWNYEDDFFGGYNHGKKGGMAVISDHHNAPGKKFFEWGKGAEGAMWDKILTDADGPYLELMAGGYSDNQPDYSWIQPGEMKVVEQYFYPIRELGGIKDANLDAAVNLELKGNSARVAFNTTAKFDKAKAILRLRDKALLEQTIDIAPDKPFAKEVSLPEGTKAEDLRAALVDAKGKELVAYQPKPRKNSPMPPRVVPPGPPSEIKSNDELYWAGMRLEQFHNPALEPYPYYEEALKRDPGDYRCNVALAILYLKRGMYKQAEERLNAAIARATKNYTNPKDTEAFYYLGVALKAQGRLDEAANAFEKAAWGAAWSSLAESALMETLTRQGRYADARRIIVDSETPFDGPKAIGTGNALARRLGLPCAVPISGDKLDAWELNEVYLIAKSEPERAAKALAELRKVLRGNVFAYLEMASDYAAGGLWDEAIDILDRFIADAPDKNKILPLVHYHLGYYWSQKGDDKKALEQYKLAAKMPADYCFPWQLEQLDSLQHAMKLNPADAKAPYYLGNLLYDLQPEVATAMWEKSRRLDPAFATVHRNLALAYSRQQRDLTKAVASLEKAVECDANDARFYAELDALYEANNADPARRLAMLESHHATVARSDVVLRREIAMLTFAGKYDRAVELLSNNHFRLWEGETGTHDLHMDAYILRGRQYLAAKRFDAAAADFLAAMEYPDRYETAKPTGSGGRLIQANYFLGLAYEGAGKSNEARECFTRASGSGFGGRGQRGDSDLIYFQAMALRKLGQADRAAALFDSLIRDGSQRLKSAEEMDFFAKFGTRQSPMFQQASAHYLIGLGQLGKGDRAAAKASFQASLKLNRSHLWASVMMEEAN